MKNGPSFLKLLGPICPIRYPTWSVLRMINSFFTLQLEKEKNRVRVAPLIILYNSEVLTPFCHTPFIDIWNNIVTFKPQDGLPCSD
ncbi:hypothetical protein BH23THE1_BH23THE1_10220 [soil metagenome]